MYVFTCFLQNTAEVITTQEETEETINVDKKLKDSLIQNLKKSIEETQSEVETTTEAPTEHTHNYSRNLTTIPNCTTASVTIYYSMIDSTK